MAAPIKPMPAQPCPQCGARMAQTHVTLTKLIHETVAEQRVNIQCVNQDCCYQLPG